MATADTAGISELGRAPLARNYVLLTAGECVSKLFTFIAFTYLGRTLGAERYGGIEFALAAMVFFTLPVDLGLGDYGAREVAREPRRAAALLQDVTSLRFLLAAASAAALALFILVIRKPVELKILLGLYGLSLFGAPWLLQWFFQAHDRMHWVAIASITRNTAFAALVLLIVRAGTPVSRIGLVECLSVLAAGAACRILLRRKLGLGTPRLSFDLRRLGAHIREAGPIGLSQVAWAFSWYFATLLLGFILADRSVGWFAAAHRVVMALHTFVWLYFFNLLPSISRSAAMSGGDLKALMRRSITVVAWGSTFVALVVTFVAPAVMTAAYGPDFAGAGRVLALLIWMIPVSMLSGHYRYTLIGCNRQKLLLEATGGSAALTVLLCSVLAPAFGAIGAAAGLLAGNVFNFALSYYFVRRHLSNIPFRSQLGAPAAAVLAATAVFAVVTRSNVWAAAVAGAAVYLILLYRAEGPELVNGARELVSSLPRRPLPYRRGSVRPGS